MQSAYHIDSDDEEEDVLPINVPKSSKVHSAELETLKAKTGELLDPAWKNQRNKLLLNKMLELEEPTVTAKMVDFMLQEGVCKMLLGYITQVGTNQPRPTPTDNKSDALRLAYRAVMLLTADEPTEALMAFLSKRVSQLSRGIFDIYRDDSAASFYHGYRMLECLLRSFPGEVYDSICTDEQLGHRVKDMLRYVGYAPVGESLSMLVALTPVSRQSQLYALSSKSRWMFFERLNRLNFMQLLVEVVVHPEGMCFVGGTVSAEQHSACAAFVLQELVEKLSVEDIGELLLQPFGYTPKLLDSIIDTALHGEVQSIRRSATKLLCFLMRRVAEADILFIVSPGPGAPPAPAYVPNRLYPLRERIITHIRTRLHEFMSMLLSSAQNPADPATAAILGPLHARQPVTYSAYTVSQPFTVLRSMFMELLTLLVEADDTVAEMITVDLWRVLMHWTIQYAQNSIFHAIFYRLVFSVLRQDDEQAQRNLFQKAKFVSFVVDSFVPFPSSAADLPGARAPGSVQNKFVARGILMNCANAIRLQANSQPPTAFLCQFLSSHKKWTDFLPVLNAATEVQQCYAFGVRVPEHGKGGSHHGERGGGVGGGGVGSVGVGAGTPVAELKVDEGGSEGVGEGEGDDSESESEPESQPEPEPQYSKLSFGSRYAKSLGFFDEISLTSPAISAAAGGSAGHSSGSSSGSSNNSEVKKNAKKAKKKSKKRKSKGGAGGGGGSHNSAVADGSTDGDEEDEEEESSDADSGSDDGLDIRSDRPAKSLSSPLRRGLGLGGAGAGGGAWTSEEKDNREQPTDAGDPALEALAEAMHLHTLSSASSTLSHSEIVIDVATSTTTTNTAPRSE